ncbi:hypothetical protein V5O48_003131 [Marasmius crinis-equi]|uniref:glutathione transferase n=1 Tax=Marasmius crinis-equi TaxID=585013 RepID=A0ABR3FTN3_9AGAR
MGLTSIPRYNHLFFKRAHQSAMVLQLYGSTQSTCTKRVAVVLYEKQIPYEFHEIDWTKNEHKSPEYLEKQVFGQVPYIVDDGFLLFESRAICRYLAFKYADKGPRLIPVSDDLKAIALFEQGASIEQANFDVFAAKAVLGVLSKKMRGLAPDAELFTSLIEQLDTKLKAYEVILGKQKYIGGDELSVADLFHLPYGALLAPCGSNILSKQGPNVTRWWNDISSRPAWKTVEDGVPLKPTFQIARLPLRLYRGTIIILYICIRWNLQLREAAKLPT